jgi:hypothetical protein
VYRGIDSSLGGNIKDMDTKLSFLKELVVLEASLSGTKRFHELDLSRSDIISYLYESQYHAS